MAKKAASKKVDEVKEVEPVSSELATFTMTRSEEKKTCFSYTTDDYPEEKNELVVGTLSQFRMYLTKKYATGINKIRVTIEALE